MVMFAAEASGIIMCNTASALKMAFNLPHDIAYKSL